MSSGTRLTEKLVQGMAPARDNTFHKNDFGHVLICAGSEYMTGALVLCVSSALRSGAGLVTAFAPEEALAPVKFSCPCALTSPWGDDVAFTLRRANDLMQKTTAAAIGPGLDEKDPRSKALVELFLNEANALVIDAGALNIISKHKEVLLPLMASRKQKGLLPAVITPHKGEMKRLLGEDPTHEACLEFAVNNTCLLVLKDHETRIYTPHDSFYYIEGDNSGMAKGGSGDVLTGLAAGFLAQGIKPCNAGAAAVYLHAKAGSLAMTYIGARYMLPTDLIDNLCEAFEDTGWR